MRQKIISVSKAKAKLLELTRNVNEEGYAYLLTKDGEPVSALIPLKDYETLTETLDVLSDQESLKNLSQALEDEKSLVFGNEILVGNGSKQRKLKARLNVRGAVSFGWLSREDGKTVPVILLLTSISLFFVLFQLALFGWSHLYQGPIGVIQTTLGAVGFTWVYLKSGNLWNAIIVHSFYDVWGFVLIYLILILNKLAGEGLEPPTKGL